MSRSSSRPKSSKPDRVICPFTVLIDSREQAPYFFDCIRADAKDGGLPLIVNHQRVALKTGDYSLFGYPQIAIERKSKADLYASVARRDNFVGRLERMSELEFSAVVVEAQWYELLRYPPEHTRYPPKSLYRTILAWEVRYPVKWLMMPDRDHAEVTTFRLIERYWKDKQDEMGGQRG